MHIILTYLAKLYASEGLSTIAEVNEGCASSREDPKSTVDLNSMLPIFHKEYFHSLVTDLGKHLTEDRKLEHTDIHECDCAERYPHNNRFNLGNTRTKMEDLICSHVIDNGVLRRSVRILSLGSGGCLQDLMVILKLADEGAKSIYIAMVEPDDRAIYDRAYSDFVRIVNGMKIAYGISITCQRFTYVSDIDVRESFDIVYGVDYDAFEYGSDYSDRKLQLRTGDFDTTFYELNTYFAVIDLIKAINLVHSLERSLIVFSVKGNMLSLPLKATKHGHYEALSLSMTNCNPNDFDLFYINADMCVLLINLEYISLAKKPIWINKIIIREEDRAAVEAFMNRYELVYEFVDDSIAITRFLGNSVLVMDYTVFLPEHERAPVPEIYRIPNVSIIRTQSITRIQLYVYTVQEDRSMIESYLLPRMPNPHFKVSSQSVISN